MMNRKSFRKSGSFVLKKSPSMEVIPAGVPNYSDHYSKPALVIPRSKSHYYESIQFPNSHDHQCHHKVPPSTAGDGKEYQMHHPSHPQHPLAQVSSPYLFTCMGCKEFGAGTAFSCLSCSDFQLHDFCATASPAFKSHPLHPQHQLIFHSKTGKNGILWPRCDICNKAIKGFTYRCSRCNFVMHPCCAQLSTEMKISAHPHILKILPAAVLTSSGGDQGYACAHCEKKRSSRVYGCKECDYHLHAVCAKNMFNGLHANGIEPPEKPSMLGAAARIASHVVVGFIGGLIEGIGEGVGEVLVQSITKARRWNSRSE